MDQCSQHAAEFASLGGGFTMDPSENSAHYNAHAYVYDQLQAASGFNDPFELAKTAVEKLGQPGQPLAAPDVRIVDFGCGSGLMGV